jgi:hypothetical protein
MSRTYRRRDHVERDCNCGAPIRPKFSWTYVDKVLIIHESITEEINRSHRLGLLPDRECRCDFWHYDNHKRNYKRDRKDYNKADKGYKTVTKKIRKAKERSAMARGNYENIPTFRNSNDYDIN